MEHPLQAALCCGVSLTGCLSCTKALWSRRVGHAVASGREKSLLNIAESSGLRKRVLTRLMQIHCRDATISKAEPLLLVLGMNRTCAAKQCRLLCRAEG